jgi:hypothetical protein
VKSLLAFFLAACSLYAQNAQIAGFVRDPSGSVILNASLTVTNGDTGAERKGRTNDSGLYAIPLLQPGNYRMLVEASGFQTQRRDGIVLEVAQNARIDFSMEVGATQQAVTVHADASAINSTDGSVSTVVDRQFVENVPLNGRSFQTLFQLTPGVVITPANSNNPNQFSVNGQRPNSNYLTVDGVSANVGIGAGSAGPGAAGAQMATSILGGTNNIVSVDAVQEFRIQTSSFAPEYGRTPGGQISIVTRSGTSQFHGSIFDYFRNDKLDANSWFANQTHQPRPAERPKRFWRRFRWSAYQRPDVPFPFL